MLSGSKEKATLQKEKNKTKRFEKKHLEAMGAAEREQTAEGVF